jgi:LytS/YehU family sensor histidine kinase
MPLARTPPTRVGTAIALAAAVSAACWTAGAAGWWFALTGERAWEPQAGRAVLMVLPGALGGLGYVLSVTVHYLVRAFDDSIAASRRALATEVAHRDAELRALRAQVDPHFLFNSLNSIGALTLVDASRAREMCQRLADFLRETQRVGSAPRIALAREVALAEQYLRVEQARFGARLQVDVQLADDCGGIDVPPLILQPLVENAVRHGIATCLEGGAVEVGARRSGERLLLHVRNPRDPDGAQSGTGRGLALVRGRLAAAYAGQAALAIASTAGTYVVSLSVPISMGGREL